MPESRVLTVYIDRPWSEIYAAVWRPEKFPEWAAGLSKSHLRKEGDTWHADGPEGPITVRFTDHNPYGVMDRVIASGEGAEVQLTLFRQPGMTDEKYRADAEMVKKDLESLRRLVTRG